MRDGDDEVPEKAAFDLEEVLDRFGGDLALVVQVARVFLEDSPATLVRVREAVEAGDAGALHHAAHALKGSVANFGAEGARAAALELERMGREGDLSHARPGLDRLEHEMSLLVAHLRRVVAGEDAG